LNSPPPLFSFIPFFPHSWNSVNRYLFSIYIHVYTVFAAYSTPVLFLHLPPPPIGISPHRQDLFCPPVLWFCKSKKKKLCFGLFKIATKEISLWHFHAYMYYCPMWFISSFFLLSTLVPFLWLFQPV
jgi:hypothetical protein